MPFKKRKSLGGHRLQRGLEKLQPKWANPTAGKAFYFFFLSSVFMEISLLPSVSFWSGEFLFCRFLFLHLVKVREYMSFVCLHLAGQGELECLFEVLEE